LARSNRNLLDPGRFGQIRPDPAGSRPFWPNPAAWPESGNIPVGIWSVGGRIPADFRWTDSGAGWIPATRCCRTLAPAGFQRPAIAKFCRSDIKHSCKDEELNFEKRITVLKIVNRFPKIKETFTVKSKMIFVDHYFRPYQTSKNVEIIFQKSFYSETNGTLVEVACIFMFSQ